jgi:hypothetical protein
LPDARTLSFGGFPTAQLAVAALGLLAFTAEHSTGLIRTTFAAVPRRPAVVAAKAATAGAEALAAGEVLAFASFFLTQAILSGHHRGLSLAHHGGRPGENPQFSPTVRPRDGQPPGTRTSPD